MSAGKLRANKKSDVILPSVLEKDHCQLLRSPSAALTNSRIHALFDVISPP
jgi:hypothetical protein